MRKHYSILAKLHLYFFKSTIVLTLTCQLLGALYLAFLEGMSVSELMNQPISFMPFGLLLDMLYKEMSQKETYYFYYNQGIRKAELWIVTVLGWMLLLMSINSIYRLCANA
jgi:glycopeptide antibiotics resistance protein